MSVPATPARSRAVNQPPRSANSRSPLFRPKATQMHPFLDRTVRFVLNTAGIIWLQDPSLGNGTCFETLVRAFVLSNAPTTCRADGTASNRRGWVNCF